MEYNDFKKYLMDKLKNDIKYNKFSVLLLEKGFSVEDAKRINFPLTKNASEFNEWVIVSNYKYFGKEDSVLLGDILLIIEKKNDDAILLDLKNLYEQLSKMEQEDYMQYFDEFIDKKLNMLKTPAKDIYTKHCNDYDIIKKMLFIRPLAKFQVDKKSLNQFVYDEFNDILLVLYINLSDENDKQVLLSSKILKTTFDSWEKNKEDVMYEALINTYANAQPRLYNYLDVIKDDTILIKNSKIGAFMAFNLDPGKYDLDEVLFLTTTKMKNGAIALFYPNVLQKLYEIVGGEYYVLIADISSCFILNSAWDMEKVKLQINMLTGTEFIESFEDYTPYLSEYIYKYDNKTKKLNIFMNIQDCK